MQAMAGEQQLMQLDVAQVKNELALTEPTQIVVVEDRLGPDVLGKANEFLEHITNYDPADPKQVDLRNRAAATIDSFGEDLQREAARTVDSPMLDQSLERLAARGEDGGDIAKSLMALNAQVQELDPSGVDLTQPGGLKRLLRFLPWVGNPIANYFTKYQAANMVLKEIVQSMINGREQLDRDNKILSLDQVKMREISLKLEDQIILGKYLDERLDYMLQRELSQGDPRYRFVAEELLFPLRQRIQDLQQQLAVNQQGVLVYEVIIRNNKELIKGVKRAEMSTMTALKVAVAASLALGNQKLVLDILDSVNETTANLIDSTSMMLKQQGVEIQKRAGEASLDMETLTRAMQNVNDAIDDISNYRMAALDKMNQNIRTMDELNNQAKERIERMEKANQMKPLMLLEA